ncbi:MAG: 50S ribosomal protein L4 [Candidatus Omnitrophica bacterium]|nr:50S ribosomal protein L4 [Candidatus Omnitrophota bacterium]MDD5670928.1 50S ribosomal protein L4 [Candidatus Omnitrophota bacterium]
MKAPLYSKEGHKKGEVVLNPEIYGTRVNQRLLHLVRTAYAANLRSGTANTKIRKEVQGGGKKPWRQKGTGRARAGSIRSPIWKGGGVVFGPHPRDYTVHMGKTMRSKAIVSALSLRAGEKSIVVIEDLALETPKTKEWVEIMKALPVKDKKVLCVVRAIGTNLKRASRNYKKVVELKLVNELNAYHILQREKLLIEQEALPILETRLLGAVKPADPESASS